MDAHSTPSPLSQAWALGPAATLALAGFSKPRASKGPTRRPPCRHHAEQRRVNYNAGGCLVASPSLIAKPLGRAAAASVLYDRDLNAWAKQQAEALRRRDMEAIDWENVIEELEGVGRAQREPWLTNCETALERMLLIEHCNSPSVSNLKRWKSDIGDSQLGMAEAISDNPSLREECAEMLSLAWDVGRSRAVRRLAAHASDKAEVVDAQLPKECPYLLEHVVGYDPRRAEEPEWETYPPAVAKVLNRALGGGHEILRDGSASARGWSR